MKTTTQIFYLTLCGAVASVILGYLGVRNFTIFELYDRNFQFVSCGVMGALFFSLLKFKSFIYHITFVIFFAALQIMIAPAKIPFSYISSLLYFASLLTSLQIYNKLLIAKPGMNDIKTVAALPLIYSFMQIIAGGVISIILNIDFSIDFYIIRIEYALFVGLGLSLGINFYLWNKEWFQEHG